jgi:prepilin-type N-terminal cleavage/methylation domain-containing protein
MKTKEARITNRDTVIRDSEFVIRRAGFTLLEMLIVIVIIGILVSLTIIGVTKAITVSKISNTQSTIQSITHACETYHTRWGDYPPSNLASYKGVKPPNDTNNGVESLVASLSSKARGGILYQPPATDLYGNTDEDELPKNPTDSYFGEPYPLNEYLDFFGHPLTYIHHDDYAKPPAGILKYRASVGVDADEVKVYKSGMTKNWELPDKFQITSRGADGKLGTEDDIFGW